MGKQLMQNPQIECGVGQIQACEIRATLVSTGRQNLLLEQIVSRLSLEPGVSGVSWEIVSETE